MARKSDEEVLRMIKELEAVRSKHLGPPPMSCDGEISLSWTGSWTLADVKGLEGRIAALRWVMGDHKMDLEMEELD